MRQRGDVEAYSEDAESENNSMNYTKRNTDCVV